MRPIEPFRIVVPDQTLDDLAARLSRARLPSPPILEGGETPETIRRIEELLHYWRNGYDWRAQEHRLNELPHYRATVSGAGIHFVHAVGSGPDPLPLLLANGWPSSFVEYLGVLGPLTDPAAHGGDAADSFTVIIPALPGYGFSDRCLDRDVGRFWIAELFNRLMVEHLGYRRYVAHGDDIGGGVVNRIGMRHADAVVALQKANPLSPHFDGYAEPSLPAEHDFRAGEEAWDHTEGAYAHVQATRPQTLAYGLNDSPIGLAAWILEKLLTWSDPATRGKLAADDLLTTVMIYWVTETIGSSIRLNALPPEPFGPDDVVTVPTSVLAPHEPNLPAPPETWLRRVYPKLSRFVMLDEGGHFLALESPERFVEEVRDAFRPYR